MMVGVQCRRKVLEQPDDVQYIEEGSLNIRQNLVPIDGFEHNVQVST